MGEIESEEEVNNNNDNDDDDVEQCSLSNPIYSRLLNSKLDSCPPQPFNERTNILWGAVYDIARRGNDIHSMSRWEQIQRGYIRKESILSNMHSTARSNHKSDKRSSNIGQRQKYAFVDTIIDVNDLLQTHDSLDDIVRNSKPESSTILAKATGSLEELLNANERQEENETGIEMRNHLKWKKRQLKLHIKKKRRDKYRMRKKAMQQRNNQ